ncbi:hypothetical protein J416_02369 [Gracilibacillus halophilus YIM-C55.5]|uniref:STAS/SEC14 domain-containing protein n=1 Tax=Gracilibacillus halophilus YIM-C55.5 TaxID=1308866 RepID=N4WYD8_9BACI|nr:STAS/SEC14 domain-containing protein [Gracilibacillus halophilus]ENH98051.1 hypothetical protein J416_02369 [Gracilibacillus halophilus YIM-C55.5]
MWEATIIDKKKKIVGLKWSGNVKKEEVHQANEKLEQLIHQLNTSSFNLLVELENLMAFSKETQAEIVEQQKWILEKGMNQAAVIADKATTKMQLKRTAKTSNHQNEHHFDNYDEALAFLQNN